MPQLKVPNAAMKIEDPETKIQHSQMNTYFFKNKENLYI